MIHPKIRKFILIQLIVSLVFAVGCEIGWGSEAAISGGLGGSIAAVASLAYAIRASLVKGKTAQEWVHAQYAGERFKFMTTVILMVVVARVYSSLHWLEFLLGYMATLTVYFTALLWEK
ncbi:ATP synthase subunit I [Ferrovum sp.]|uniref:ATP synthase subunit I n=1 Tax=Ferrovum sp. TaxID=2609467 RepID=UPI002634723A|nr:ATP synthase subunit I [Ferrovum sp.]